MTRRLETSETDRAARLRVIELLQAELEAIPRSKLWRVCSVIYPESWSR